MTHVADKQQRASVQRNFRAIGGGVLTIVIQFTYDLPTVFSPFSLAESPASGPAGCGTAGFYLPHQPPRPNLRSREWY